MANREAGSASLFELPASAELLQGFIGERRDRVKEALALLSCAAAKDTPGPQ